MGGNWIHQGGFLALFGGRLDITGNYLQQRDADGDGTYETYCSHGILTGTGAIMSVGGNAQFWANMNNLRDGTLEIKGNFLQKTGPNTSSGYDSFQAYGTHRVLLNGAATQTVTFEHPGDNYFNVLEVTTPLAVTSTVSVANGGNLKLNYNGTDVVGALYLGGTQQANGLYDSANTGGLITGTGKIQVGPFVSYSAWTAANAPGQATAQDHDHDGVPNGIEYFMGKSGSDFTANPGIAADGTVTWPKSPAFSGNYAVQTSADLKEWMDATDDPVQVTKNSDSVVWTRPSGPGSRFVRLLVTPN